jgi:hypothetical protein
MALAVVTFADTRFAHMHRRFRVQAKRMRVFDYIWTWTEHDLQSDFRRQYAHLLLPGVKGYGYFVWKPQVILQALGKLQLGDSLIYLDSGSHFNARGRGRLLDYLRLAGLGQPGILAFQLHLKEADWTKADLLDFFAVIDRPEISETPQVQAGAIVIHKRPGTEQLFHQWLEVFASAPWLVDDSASARLESATFKAHRHDQSVFSILAKLRGVRLLPASEQYPQPGESWGDLFPFPIHHRRDKARSVTKVLEAVEVMTRPVQLILVRTKSAVVSYLKSR